MRRLVAATAALLPALALLAVPVTADGAAAPPARGRCASGTVALTFDDGPSATVTPRLVRILRRTHVPATFFLVGERVDAAPDVARRLGEAGFLVANHSYAHADMTHQSSAAVRATLRATERSMRRAGLQPTDLMRPPYGAIDDAVRSVVADEGLVPVLWDVDPRDWEGDSSGEIAARILDQLRPHRSNVVLQHDGIANSPASVAAVPRVIEEARDRGYCFVALDERGRPGFPTPHVRLGVEARGEGRTATATLTLDRPTARGTTVRLRTRGRTATAGADFRALDTLVRFAAGETVARVSLPLVRDGLDEPDERFEVRLSRPQGLVLDQDGAVVVVADRDAAPGVSGVDLTVAEPTGADATVRVRFDLGRVSGRTVRVRVEPVWASATAADVVLAGTVVTIPAGHRGGTLAVRVRADLLDEPTERLRLRIVSAVNAEVRRRVAVLTITPPA